MARLREKDKKRDKANLLDDRSCMLQLSCTTIASADPHPHENPNTITKQTPKHEDNNDTQAPHSCVLPRHNPPTSTAAQRENPIADAELHPNSKPWLLAKNPPALDVAAIPSVPAVDCHVTPDQGSLRLRFPQLFQQDDGDNANHNNPTQDPNAGNTAWMPTHANQHEYDDDDDDDNDVGDATNSPQISVANTSAWTHIQEYTHKNEDNGDDGDDEAPVHTGEDDTARSPQ